MLKLLRPFQRQFQKGFTLPKLKGLNTFIDKLKKLGLRKILYGLSGLIAALLLILLMRSCNGKPSELRSYYIVGRDSAWYPLQLFGKEKNLVGFTNDLFYNIMKETGIQFQWLESSGKTLLEGLDEGYFDAIISPLRPNIVNQESHQFSELIIEIGPVLIVRKDSPISSLEETEGKTIGIITNSNALIFNAIRKSGAHSFDFNFVRYATANQAIEAMIRNHIDGVILDAIPAYTLSEGFYADSIKVVTGPLNDEGLRLVALKTASAEALIEKFDAALDKMEKDGTYDALIKKWDLIDPSTRYHH